MDSYQWQCRHRHNITEFKITRIGSGGRFSTQEIIIENEAISGGSYVRFINNDENWKIGVDGNFGDDFVFNNGSINVLRIEHQITSEALRIDQNGNVGIGTTSPTERLHVIGGTNTRAIIETQVNGGSSALRLDANPNYWEIKNYGASANLGITRGTSEFLTVDNTGNLGIGTSSPAAKLDVNGSIYPTTDNTNTLGLSQHKEWAYVATRKITGNNNRMVLELSGETVILRDHNSIGDGVQIKNRGSVVAQFGDSAGSGNVGIGTTSPSARLHADNTETTGVGAIFENSNASNTGDIAQFQNSTGTVASITNDGYITAQAATGTSDTVAIWDGTTLKKKELKNRTILTSQPYDIVNASSTEYGGFGGGLQFLAEQNVPFYISSDGTISKLYLNILNAQSATGSNVITVRKNGVDTPLTVTIPAGGAAGVYSDTTNSFTVSEGDILTYKLVNSATIPSGRIISLSVEFQFD